MSLYYLVLIMSIHGAGVSVTVLPTPYADKAECKAAAAEAQTEMVLSFANPTRAGFTCVPAPAKEDSP